MSSRDTQGESARTLFDIATGSSQYSKFELPEKEPVRLSHRPLQFLLFIKISALYKYYTNIFILIKQYD